MIDQVAFLGNLFELIRYLSRTRGVAKRLRIAAGSVNAKRLPRQPPGVDYPHTRVLSHFKPRNLNLDDHRFGFFTNRTHGTKVQSMRMQLFALPFSH